LKGFNYKHPAGRSNDGLWPDSSVRRILQNEIYIGNMVQGKNTTYSYKIKQCRAIPKEDWIIVEGTHEPIVSKEIFEKAQSLFNKNIRVAPQKKEVDLFSGFVKCADCLRAMHKKTNVHSYATYHYYRCATTRKMKKSACSNHTIRIDKLEELVLITIQQMIDVAIDMNDMLEKINACSSRQKESTHLKKTIEAQTAEREKCMRMMVDLYPDFKNGIINQEEYAILKQNLTEKIENLDKMIANLTETAKSYEEGVNDENEFIAHFKKYGKIKSLTRAILTELVEEILVHEDKKITIVFKFQDPYKEAMDYIEMNKDIVKTA
ncbi:MAG: recombinase family protein, partial [Clostridia bacterium]